MYTSRDLPVSNPTREAFRYQPFFDLRKNIAKVVADYTLAAIQKNILLDIFISHETPNYYQGDLTGFSRLLSELLKICIDSLAEGEICIRIDHDSIHKTNNCDTELAINIITFNSTEIKNKPEDNLSSFEEENKENSALKTFASILLIQHLCRYFNGDIRKRKLDDRKTQYSVNLILQRSHPARMLYQA
jgi:hypothetical protein